MLDAYKKRDISRILVGKLNSATQRSQLAKARFKELIGSVPTGIPAPDSSLRIREAGAVYRQALAESNEALERWRLFVTAEIVPEDIS